MTDRDYNVCPEDDAGEHDPRAALDPETPAGYFTIQCATCGQTTGVAMPDPQDIEWN
jgi:rRNA maturation protein Nop10